jgi:sugar lactone lactonase YvrE
VSAAGWIDQDHLLIASEVGLLRFNIETGEQQLVCQVEAEMTTNRSNDGRADPWGGFWFGTMGKRAEPGAGRFYRYYQGEVRELVRDISITNSLCFSPSRRYVYYADTVKATVWRQALSDSDGWPIGTPEVFLDLRELGLNPDGAVCDNNGNIWIAFWGANKVCGFNSSAEAIGEYLFPASQVSCPAFGGANYQHLYVTSAAEGLTSAQIVHEHAGQTFVITANQQGQPEPQVNLHPLPRQLSD